MNKIKYLIRCAFNMNYAKMLRTAWRIGREYKKPGIVILLDMIWCAFRYGAGYVDYQIFTFAGLTGRQRATFVTRGINNEFIRRLNSRADYDKFRDKITFNRLFGDYLGREWLYLKEVGPETLAEFLRVRNVIIAKPTDAICGKGIEKIPLTGDEDAAALHARFTAAGQLLIEECIRQHPELDRIYPGSVNTLRLVTIAKVEKVHIVFRAMRIGAEGRVVDNFNSGGMFVLVDETGRITTPAINKETVVYETHPATGTKFEGFGIPFFAEAEELVRSAARVVPGMRYVGWDVAITEGGPVLVEGNHNPGHDILQSKVYLADHDTGVLPVFRQAIGS